MEEKSSKRLMVCGRGGALAHWWVSTERERFGPLGYACLHLHPCCRIISASLQGTPRYLSGKDWRTMRKVLVTADMNAPGFFERV